MKLDIKIWASLATFISAAVARVLGVGVLYLFAAFFVPASCYAPGEPGRHKALEIYVMNLDGTHIERLTASDSGDDYPAWSPDGKKIAFMSRREGNGEIYVMDADGDNPIRLTNNEFAGDGQPAWSPDGNKIASNS